nr:hypothetical protein [Tanacetum cinerariifolium]
MTIEKLLENVIGIYIEPLEQGGMRILFSTFLLPIMKYFRVHISQLVPMGVNRVTMFEICYRNLRISSTVSLFWVFNKLCKQGHWFSIENKTSKLAKNCFNEITSSLKGWKKKFFLINRRAMPDAMAWRHMDKDVSDDFPIIYNEGDTAKKPDKKIAEAQEKKEQQALLKSKAKRSGKGNNDDGGCGYKPMAGIWVTTMMKSDTSSRMGDFKLISRSAPTTRAELLKRFEKLNHNHLELIQRHEGCQELSDKLSQPKNDYKREKDMIDQLRDMGKVRDEWRQTSSKQVEKIKKLVEGFGPKS